MGTGPAAPAAVLWDMDDMRGALGYFQVRSPTR